MLHALLIIGVGFILSQGATFATTIYLHRCATHSAFKVSPWTHRFFRFVIWLLTGQITREWVGVHRKHHAFSDEDGDPHSPYELGFWHVQLANAYYYVREKKNPETVAKYARDVYSDGWDRLFNTGILGPILGVSALCALLGIRSGFAAAGVHLLLYVGVLTSCINAIGHHRVWTAYQNYGERYKAEKTFNYRWLAWLTGGEGLHNNHHGRPQRAFLAHMPGEEDPAAPIIRWMERLGLAWDVHYV